MTLTQEQATDSTHGLKAHPYVGSGPYCYANFFAMLLGERAPSTAVIEVATGGPFGMQVIGGTTVFFDAYGWNPELRRAA